MKKQTIRVFLALLACTVFAGAGIACRKKTGNEPKEGQSVTDISEGAFVESDEELFLWIEYQGRKEVVGLTEKGASQTELTIPESATHIGVVLDPTGTGEDACPNIKVIRFANPKTEIDSLSAFTGLEELYLPAEIEDIPLSLSANDSLKKVVCPSTITDITRGFNFMKALEEVELPEGLEEIGDSAFECCESLKNVEIPSTVKKIGFKAYFMCENLKEKTVVVPEGVTSIGQWAFYGTWISEIYLPATLEEIEGNLDTAEPYLLANCTVYVKEGSWADLNYEEYRAKGQTKAYY